MLLDIPAGMGNTYTYDVPPTCRTTLLVPQPPARRPPQTYAGLAGLLEIGRPDGNLPAW